MTGGPGMDRVWVIGPAGAGKTTLARALGSALDLPHHQLDGEFWGPGWTRTPRSEFVARVASLAAHDRWVIDGQYRAAHPVLTSRAQTVIWLDLPLRTTLPRLVRRGWRDLRSRRALYSGNRQTLGGMVRLLWWAARADGKIRRTNRRLEEFTGPRLRRLCGNVDVERLLGLLWRDDPAA